MTLGWGFKDLPSHLQYFFNNSADCVSPSTFVNIDIFSAILEMPDNTHALVCGSHTFSIHLLQICVGLCASITITIFYLVVNAAVSFHTPSFRAQLETAGVVWKIKT